jgi:RecA/RadA recombinase
MTKNRKGAKGKGKKGKVKEDVILHQYEMPGKYENAKQFAKDATKSLRGNGKIVTGADVDDIEHRKIVTGVPFFDYVTNGGVIMGGAAQFWGRFKSTKTTLLAIIIRNLQLQGKVVALASIERFMKPWWRQIGVYIRYGSKEMDRMSRADRKNAERYNTYFEKRSVPPLTLIVHQDSVQSLELVYRTLASNSFDLVAVDSLGAVVDSSEVEDKNLADKKYGGESAIFTQFHKKVVASQKYTFDENNVKIMTGSMANQSSLICINQARQELGADPKYSTWDELIHPVGGEALHHLWDQSLAFQGSTNLRETVAFNGKPKKQAYAREFDIKGVKMRGGPEQREVKYSLYVKSHESDSGRKFRAGQLDNAGCLRALAAMLEVTEQSGSSINYDGQKFKGKGAFEKALDADKGMYDQLYTAMLAEAHRQSQSSPVPEVWNYGN